jgi:uncharacterized membrane protein YdbT with pleckstrin-like domain
MKFIKKKNMMAGEELLYIPRLHWVYTVKCLLLSLPFFLILAILWVMADSTVYSIPGVGITFTPKLFLIHVFFFGVLIVLGFFLCRVFLYLSTEYGVTNKRLILKKGIIRMVIAEIPTDRIESIYCVQGLMGRIFHYAAIYISGIGGTMPVFHMVAHPYALRRKIVDIIEKNKAITVVHGDIPLTEPVKEPVVQREPLYRYGTFVRVLP